MCVESNARIEDVAFFIREKGLSIEAKFGSGGYVVSVTDLKTKITYNGHSYDISEAVKIALNKALDVEDLNSPSYREDEKTVPAIPRLINEEEAP